MMRGSASLAAVLCILGVAALIGCDSMFDSSSSASGGGGTDTIVASVGENSSTTYGGGSFVEVGGDVLDVRPEEVEIEEEGEETASNFRAIQVDPAREDTAGPKFVLNYDMDNDGLVDLVTGWNENQPVQLHLQRRDQEGKVSFVSVNLGGTSPTALIGDLAVADFDVDGWLDVVIASKVTGVAGVCPDPGADPPYSLSGWEGEIELLFNPGNFDEVTDGDAWEMVRLARSRLPGREDKDLQVARTYPEWNGYTGIAAGELDGINGPDIVVAYNPVDCEFYGDKPPLNRIVIYPNPGGINTRDEADIPMVAVADAGDDLAVIADAQEVMLNGLFSYVRFPDRILGTPAFSWQQVSGPAVNLVNPGGPTPSFATPPAPAQLSFRLIASAGNSEDFDYVNVLIGDVTNSPPWVVASEDESIIPDVDNPGGSVIQMLAAAADPDGDPLTYSWIQIEGPSVSLTGSTTSVASFEAPEQGGELRFRVTVTDGTLWASDLVVITTGVWAPIRIDTALARAGDVAVSDVDLDGDNDVLYTFPDLVTANIGWARNPMIPHGPDDPSGPGASHVAANWQLRPVGHVNTEADIIALGDVDLDGFDDVLVRSQPGLIVQWFRHPGAADREPIFPPPDAVPDRFNFPWQVYSMAEFGFHKPAGIAIGDMTADGFNEVVVAAGGVVYWYDAAMAETVYDPWGENFVIDDTKANGTTDDPTDPDFIDAGTIMNALTVVDIDGDGYGDVIGTLDRRTFSGLNDDTLIWFRNTLGDEATPVELEAN